MHIASGAYRVGKGTKLKVYREAYCQGALRCRREQEHIPIGTTVEVAYTWLNFYGRYITVKFNNLRYDLLPNTLTI